MMLTDVPRHVDLIGPVELGKDVVLGRFLTLGHPGKGSGDALMARNGDGLAPCRIGDGSVLRDHGVLYAGATLGAKVQTGHHWMVREGTTIGDGSLIGSGVTIDDDCTIGSNVRMQTGVYVPTRTIIGNDVFLGPRACLTNDKWMGRKNVDLQPVTIGSAVRIGANSVILPGLHIGDDAVIGAGAVVTRDVAPGQTVVGSPARPIA